jgi:hypothetical protein
MFVLGWEVAAEISALAESSAQQEESPVWF